MAKPSELVVLGAENRFARLLPMLQAADLGLTIRHFSNWESFKTAAISPLVLLLLETQAIDFASLRPNYPQSAFVLLQENYDEAQVAEYISQSAGQYLHENQLALLPAMLKSIVEWRDQLNERDYKIQVRQTALVTLATSPALNSGDWETALREICAVTAQTLQVSRVSVWLFDALHSKIICQKLYQLSADSFSQGIELSAVDYPAYFAALHHNRTISASDAHSHPDTASFSEAYLKPLAIKSMLDAPIRVNGEVIGTLCFEHQHEMRLWTIDEEVFAGAVADLAALVLEGLEHRRIAEVIKQTEKLQSLGLLASGIAHDFNNMLTVILSQASLMADSIEKDHSAYKSVQHIVGTSRQAAALTKQLLTYAGNKPLQMASIALKAFMTEHQDFLRLALPSQVELCLGDAGDLGIEADSTQIQQVLMNLAINAAEAMGERGGCLSIEFAQEHLSENFAKPHCYKSEGFTAGDYVRLTVRDTGSGIEEKMLKQIFEPFFSTKSTGRGLGLATVLGVIRAHGGVLAVESQRGKGTSFHLYFRQATVENLEKTKTGAIPVLVSRTILVVDDAPEIVESISEILQIHGLNTLTAYNGNEALSIYRADYDLIDLILVDMAMPGMNGAETFEQLRKVNAAAKVIVLSGYNDRELLRQFPNEKPAAILAKPYDVKMLLETVWEHLH